MIVNIVQHFKYQNLSFEVVRFFYRYLIGFLALLGVSSSSFFGSVQRRHDNSLQSNYFSPIKITSKTGNLLHTCWLFNQLEGFHLLGQLVSHTVFLRNVYFGRGNKIPPFDHSLFFVYLSFLLGEEYLYFCLIDVNVNAAGLWTVCSCFIHVLFWKIKLWRILTGVSRSKHNFIFEFWLLEEKLGMVHITKIVPLSYCQIDSSPKILGVVRSNFLHLTHCQINWRMTHCQKGEFSIVTTHK